MIFRRPLIPCVLAYGLGLWLVHDGWNQWPLGATILFVIITVGCVALAVRYREMTPMYLLLIIAAGAAVMGVHARNVHEAKAVIKQVSGNPAVVISGRASAIAELNDAEKSRVVLRDVTITSGSYAIQMPGKMQVTLDNASLVNNNMPMSGERIAFPGQVYPPSALQNFFGYDRLEALRHEGIYSVADPLDVSGIVQIEQNSGGLHGKISHIMAGFRRRVSVNVQRDMWAREGRLMVAMLFNDMRGLTEDEKRIFRDSGTFHLFAVSGMHVAILGFALNLLFRAMRFGLRGSWLSVALVLLAYLWIIDFVPSATRSYLMLVAFTSGYLLRREVDAITSLVFAVAVVMFFDPAAPWKAGFVLSVTGVAAIVFFTPLLQMWFPWPGDVKEKTFLHRWAAKGMNVLFATAAVSVVLIPLQVYYFGFWNILSPVANLLQAALSTLVLSAGVIVAAVGLAAPDLARLLGNSASGLMHVVYLISEWAAAARWSIFYFNQVPLWLMLACYALFFGGYYMVFRDSPEFKLKSRARFATHTVCSLGLLVVFQQYQELRRPAVQVWAMDVGQGDATLLRFENGQTMLIDGGKADPDMGRLVVVPQLRGLGIDMLDYIVATHDDEDHTGGLASVIRNVGCRHLLLPNGFVPKAQCSKDMLAAADDFGCAVKYVGAGFSAQAGECHIQVLNPPAQPGEDRLDNDRSIILRVSIDQFVGLFMGDAGLGVEARLINEQALSGASVLKVGHHGSKSSTGEELLKIVRPSCVIVSCGQGNRYGHPATEVVERLDQAGTAIFRTDNHGATVIESDGKAVTVSTRSGLQAHNAVNH